MPWWSIVTFAFACGFLMDVVWTLCVTAVTCKKPLTAANFSALLYLCTVVSTVLIVERCTTAVAAYIVGGWLGTYFVVAHRRHSPSNPRQQQSHRNPEGEQAR
ncbi:MAG: hypothetical protein ABSE84_00350 [Isosphaeraceae bacterium]|jgi:hypothetical protein